MPAFAYSLDFVSRSTTPPTTHQLSLIHTTLHSVALRLSDAVLSHGASEVLWLLQHHYLYCIPTPLGPAVILGSSSNDLLGRSRYIHNSVAACDAIYLNEGLKLLQGQQYEVFRHDRNRVWLKDSLQREHLLMGKYSAGGYAPGTLRTVMLEYRATLAFKKGKLLVLHPNPRRIQQFAAQAGPVIVYDYASQVEDPTTWIAPP